VFARVNTGLLTKDKLFITLSLVNVALYAFFSSQIPISINNLINHVKEGADVFFYFTFFVFAFLFSRVTREMQLFIFGPLSQRLLKVLSLKSFENIFSNNLGSKRNEDLGKLTQIINNGEGSFIVILERIYYMVLPLLLEVIISSALILIGFGLKYSFTFLSVVGIYFFTVLKLTDSVRPLHKSAINETLSTRSKLHDFLSNRQLVNNYHILDVVSNKLSEQLDSQIVKFTVFFKKRFLTGVVQSLVLVLGAGFINYLELLDYWSGRIEIGFFAAINLFLLQFIKPFEEIGLALREIRFSLNNLYLFLRSTLANKSDRLATTPFSKTISTLKIRNLNFEVNEKMILSDICLDLKKGEKVALIGKTGEGKSTLCKLISGLLKPSAGHIEINGVRLSTLDELKEYKLLYVSQETLMFNDDIEFNIFFNRHVDRLGREVPLIKEYSDFFDAHDMKKNICTLSYGQKQFVSFLRAIACKPDVIFFDEINSSQDFKTYSEIVGDILELKDTSVVFVTHRLEMLELFDKTYVISNSRMSHVPQVALKECIKNDFSMNF